MELRARPPCESVSVSSDSIPQLRAWASRRNSPVTVFDIEATTFTPYVQWFGITEIGLLQIDQDGTVHTCNALVNPERKIPKRARELTGISDDDVRGQPTWNVWMNYMHEVAATHVTVGYHSLGFDCPAIIRQNERYGRQETEFASHLDVASLPGVTGTLAEAAEKRGIVSEIRHRALPDVWLTARLLDALATEHGLDALDDRLCRRRGDSGPGLRRTELLEHIAECACLPDLEEFGARHGVRRSTVEGDVLRMIEEGALPAAILEQREIQDWLAQGRLEAAIAHAWQGEATGRLRPLMELLLPGAPKGLDYTQLQLALMNRRKR